MRTFPVLAVLAAVALVCGIPVATGATPGEAAQKSRHAVPSASDIDPAVSLDGLLSKTGAGDWSTTHAASVEGYVVQVEREEDGDAHLVLAPEAGESDTHRWLIVEVTPAWQKKNKALALKALRAMRGSKVRATGWLYYEAKPDEGDPRGTPWELHPVTAIQPAA